MKEKTKIKQKLFEAHKKRTGLMLDSIQKSKAIESFLKEFLNIEIIKPFFLFWFLPSRTHISPKHAVAKETFLQKMIDLKIAGDLDEAEDFLRNLISLGASHGEGFNYDDCALIPESTYHTSPRVVFRNYLENQTIWVYAEFTWSYFE